MTWHFLRKSNQSIESWMQESRSYTPTLNWAHQLHTIPKGFCQIIQIIILKLFSDLARRYILYRGLMGFVYTFSSPCGNPWRGLAEDHGTNLLFKTWFMNNLLPSISRNSFSKILETFLEQIR